MKNFFLLTIIFLLSSCQTLSTIQETLGLVQEDPNAPVKLDESYDSFLEVNWEKNADKPLLNLDFFKENIESNLFFDINAGTIFNLKGRQIELIDMESGQLSEVFDLETDRIISGVTVGYNSFFYADADGVVYSHDSNTGDLKWTKELEDVVLSKILITSTLVFLQTSSDVLYGIDLQTGETKWQKQAQAPLLSIRGTASPTIYEGLVFTSFSNGRLAAVRGIDGIQLWEKPISRLKGSTELEKLMDGDSNAVTVNEDVFAANYNGSLTRFNIRSGEKVFSVDHSTSKTITFNKGKIFSINTDEEILGFNASNGIESWRSQKFKNRGLSDLITSDDKIYFGDFEGYIHQLDAETGMITGLTKTNLKAISQIAIFSDKLFAQDIDGSIAGFSLK